VTVLATRIETDITPVNVATSERGIVAIEMLTPSELFASRLERRLSATVQGPRGAHPGPAADNLDRTIAALEGYFAGDTGRFDVPVDLADRPDWDLAVLRGVRTVPRGTVSSYGRIARQIGKPGAARAVGGAVARNPVGIVIPCHRIIAGDGSIGGYGGAWWGARDRLLEIKRDLLELEGVTLPVQGFSG
jgi:methylated-DNA-[protein]-cysteine S-methyltransferase